MEARKILGRVYQFLLLYSLAFFLQGCASSDLSRNAASGIDSGRVYRDRSFDIVNGYQNTNQATKGAVIGGVTGGLVGGFTNGIGAFPGAATGAILGGSLGAYIDAHTTLADRLENRGVKIVVLGDQVMIVIPSNRLFDEMTANILHTAYSTLDLVAELIGNYANMSVRIAAYTNDVGSDRVNRSLSREQAINVQKYLWRRGVNTRLLYAVGNGATNLVDKAELDWRNSWNYRIEITLEKLPV